LNFRRILFLATVIAIAPSVRAEAPIFDLKPELELANTRLELAQNPPPAFRKSVAQELATLRKERANEAKACDNVESAPNHLLQTKVYLQAILLRLAGGSQIPANLLNTAYGVCVTPVDQPQGIFANLMSGPRLHLGTIRVPPKFLLEFRTEDELAFVLAHELAHFLLKHEIMYGYLTATNRHVDGFAVVSEREADELGMRMVINAGYDIDLALTRLKELRKEDSVHFVGSQLQDLRNIVMTDLEKTKRVYRPRPSESYLPRPVWDEVQVYLRQLSAQL
jgi:hypothetical protein